MIDPPPASSGLTVRRDADGRVVIESVPDGFHPGIALGVYFWGFFALWGAITTVLMVSRSVPATIAGAVFFLLGSWSVYRAGMASRSPRRITDLGDEIEIAYVVGGGVTSAKRFDKSSIQTVEERAIWRRRRGRLGKWIGSPEALSQAQPHASHLHAILIRSNLHVDTLGFSLDESARRWLAEAIRQMIRRELPLPVESTRDVAP